jgi:hypothetical protein
MRGRLMSAGTVLAGAALLTACSGARFQTAAGRFGLETEATMNGQSEQIEQVSALETRRLRDNIAAEKTLLGLHEDCQENTPDAEGRFKPCKLVAVEKNDEVVVFSYELPAILTLQDALATYGANLAELADDAEEDQAAFSASVDKLGASIGKLDAAISEAAKTDRIDSQAKIGTIASVIAGLGNLVFRFQRRHALRRIIVANDPLIQEALAVLQLADADATAYKRLAALRIAQDARVKASLAGDAERAARNEELFKAVERLNAFESNKIRLEKLAAIHGALADMARRNNDSTRTALAKKMLEDWTRD